MENLLSVSIIRTLLNQTKFSLRGMQLQQIMPRW